MTVAESSPWLRFGRFELRPRSRQLLENSAPVALDTRAFDVLLALVQRPAEVVTRTELFDRAWSGQVAEESDLALQVSRLRALLGGDVIATVPGRGYRFDAPLESAAGLHRGVTEPASKQAAADNAALPLAGGRLIGRGNDLAQLERVLDAPGCVTLVGAGGVGKTRLALAVAQSWAGHKVWVDLAPLTAGAQVAGALARALGLPVADDDAAAEIAGALGEEGALLVLDNAEHVVDGAAAAVGALLRAVSTVHVLVTSQLPLGVAGERVVPLAPLPIEADGVDAKSADGALALLLDRIAAGGHRAPLPADALPVLREVCRQLDGLPLALEMAAARVPLLGPRGVRDQLARRFALLTKGYRQSSARHRTLHAALDWSCNLLGADEQRLFATLGVFAGGFTLDLCVALVDPAGDAETRRAVTDRLAALVDRSLVAVSVDDPPRYRLLETMRAYALERLDASGEAQALRHRHAALIAQWLPQVRGDSARVARSQGEMDNVREAFEWARRNQPALAVWLSRGAALLTTFTPWRPQVYAWLASLETWVEGDGATVLALEDKVRWYIEYARLSVGGLHARAVPIARRARALAHDLGDAELLFLATGSLARALPEPGPEMDYASAELASLLAAHPEWSPRTRYVGQGAISNAARMRGDIEGLLASRLAEMALAEAIGDQVLIDATETNISGALVDLGRADEAVARLEPMIRRLEGNDSGTGSGSGNLPWAYGNLLAGLIVLRRIDEAVRLLPRFVETGVLLKTPNYVGTMVTLAEALGRPDAAVQLMGFARQTFESMNLRVPPDIVNVLAEASARLSPTMAPDRFEALLRQGRSLTVERALALCA